MPVKDLPLSVYARLRYPYSQPNASHSRNHRHVLAQVPHIQRRGDGVRMLLVRLVVPAEPLDDPVRCARHVDWVKCDDPGGREDLEVEELLGFAQAGKERALNKEVYRQRPATSARIEGECANFELT